MTHVLRLVSDAHQRLDRGALDLLDDACRGELTDRQVARLGEYKRCRERLSDLVRSDLDLAEGL